MELIAIIGKPGVGKTTISKYLDRRFDDVGYLDIDEITRKDPELLQVRNLGLMDIKNNILMGPNEKKFYDTIEKIMLKWIDEETKKGTKYGIIDFAAVHKIPNIWNLFQYKILVLKEEKHREDHLISRSGPKMTEMLDLYGKYAFDDFSYDVHFKIINNDDIDSLYDKTQKIFEIIKKLSKLNCSYFIIKPDGLRHIKCICSYLSAFIKSCNQVDFYKIDDFSTLIRKIYYKLFTIKELEFDKKFDYLIEALNSLYGNKAILVLIHKNNRNEEEYIHFINEIYKLKHEIRKNLMNTNIRIMIKSHSDEKLSDSIVFDDEEYFVALSKLLSIIHCPEPNVTETMSELGILFEDGLICDTNKLNINDLINRNLL